MPSGDGGVSRTVRVACAQIEPAIGRNAANLAKTESMDHACGGGGS